VKNIHRFSSGARCAALASSRKSVNAEERGIAEHLKLVLSIIDGRGPLGNSSQMSSRRFPPPWSVDDSDRKLGQSCFIVRDANGQALAFSGADAYDWLTTRTRGPPACSCVRASLAGCGAVPTMSVNLMRSNSLQTLLSQCRT
jgi:hypothetical protein